MARIQRVTSQAVFDLFKSLDNDSQREFVRTLAQLVGAEVIYFMLGQLPPLEQERFTHMLGGTLMVDLLPLFVQEATRMIRECPQKAAAEMEEEMLKKVGRYLETYRQKIGELEQGKLKEKRDRKSDPEIVKRNVEICDLKRANAEHWSHRRLGKKYDLSPQAISLILKDEAKWRQMAEGVK